MPVIPSASINISDSETSGVSLSEYNSQSSSIIEHRWMVDPRDIESSMAKAEKIIARANKKGLNGGFKVSLDESNGYPEIVLSGEPFSINGWTFVASIERLPNGEAIVKKSPSYQGPDVEERFLKGNLCEHCNTKKNRKVQIVVEDANGNRKIVGSTCMKDFLGWDYVPSFSIDDADIEEEFGRTLGTPAHFQIDYVLETALAVKDVYGYIPASRSDENTVSTKSRVENYLRDPEHMRDPEVKRKLESKSYKESVKEVRDVVSEETLNPETDYVRNMKSAYTGEYAFGSTIGLVISGISMVERRKASKVKEEAEAKISTEIFAPIGSKIQVKATLVRQADFETRFGYSTVYTFVGEGHRFSWFSSAAVNLETGEEYTVKGTVKDVNTYGKETATVLTRCKIE
jgi:hypothetical protein